MSNLMPNEKTAHEEERRLQRQENRLLILTGFLGGMFFLGIIVAAFVIWAIQNGLNLF